MNGLFVSIGAGPGIGGSTASRFAREGINLIGPLSDIAEKALDGIGGLNVVMHGRGKGVKRQEMLFILDQTANGFRIALVVFGFECCQVQEGVLFLLLLPDTL